MNFSMTYYKNKSRTFDPALKEEQQGYSRELGLDTAYLRNGTILQNGAR
jgi:hypothetical protein